MVSVLQFLLQKMLCTPLLSRAFYVLYLLRLLDFLILLGLSAVPIWLKLPTFQEP